MKKIILVFLAAALLAAGAALADDLNLEGKTTAELIEIQQKVNKALWKSDGWNEVKVPAGIYEIGKEIPAGDWMVGKYSSGAMVVFDIFKRNENGDLKGWEWTSYLDNEEKITAYDGQFIRIKYGPVVFKTYAPSFTFK